MKMDWLELEKRIRTILEKHYKKGINCEAVNLIDDVIGDLTERGYENPDPTRAIN